MEKKVQNVTVTSRKSGKNIWFSTNGQGQACWNTVSKSWVKVQYEFGYNFKNWVKYVFSL